MNKRKKRIGLLVLLLTFAFCNVVNVSAADMRDFYTMKEGSRHKFLTRGIQVMLLNHSSQTRSLIVNAGGADNVFGRGTTNAVKKFQALRGIGQDGIVGRNTYTQFRNTLIHSHSMNQWKFYRGYSPQYSYPSTTCMSYWEFDGCYASYLHPRDATLKGYYFGN